MFILKKETIGQGYVEMRFYPDSSHPYMILLFKVEKQTPEYRTKYEFYGAAGEKYKLIADTLKLNMPPEYEEEEE